MGAEKLAIPREIPCIVVPIMTGALLLPNVSVAEIVSHSQVVKESGRADGYLGHVTWRGLSVPVVSLVMLGGSGEECLTEDSRLAIINGSRGEKRLPFYSVVVTGLPRLQRVTPKVFQGEQHDELPAGEYCRVSISGQELVIPDLSYIEEQLLKL